MKNRYIFKIITHDECYTLENNIKKYNEKAFNIEPSGYWLGHGNAYYLNDADKINLGIDFKPNNSFSVQDKLLYRFPKLNLPRQKVDLIKEKYNCKIIRDINKSDIQIVSNNLFNSMIEYSWSPSCYFEDFYAVIKEFKNTNNLTNAAINKLDLILDDLPTDSMLTISKNSYYYNNNLTIDPLIAFTKLIDDIRKKDLSKDIIINEKYVNDYLNIIKYSSTIVYDTDIVNIIDGELAVIDNVEYDNILKMIKSNDRDNRSLALEMLSNCNLDKSYDVVSGIFYWHYDNLKDTTNWNSVNVKTLRNRMDSYKGGVHDSSIYAYNHFIKNLIRDGKLTEFALNKTRRKLYDQVLNNIAGETANVFNISFDSLNLKESLKDQLITHE